MVQESFPSISIVHSSLSSTLVKDGDIVFVRVVSDNGNGSYTASFAGNRFVVRSHSPLSAGASFKAQISIENSVVKITPLLESANEPAFNQSTASFLQRIGLPPDAVSLRLVQFFQQHNLKIDLSLAKRARSAANAFPGREKDAAEAALFLADKDIESTNDMIEILINTTRTHGTRNETDSDVLSFMNHKKTAPFHWILLPFEDKETQSIKGVVKILIHTELQKTEKMVIDCYTAVKRFHFVLQLSGFAVKNKKAVLYFCTEPESNESNKRILSNALHKLIGSDIVHDVHYLQSSADDGLFSQNQDPNFIQDSV